MTLDDIQLSIYQGRKGIDQAIDQIESYVEKKKLPDEKVKSIGNKVVSIKLNLDNIPIQTLNQIQVTERYRNYIKQVITDDKIENSIDAAKKLISIAETDSNKRILSAKEADTKRNREFEKNEVMKFFKHAMQFVNLFDIYNLMIDVKSEINR
jgi:hypothetical protein